MIIKYCHWTIPQPLFLTKHISQKLRENEDEVNKRKKKHQLHQPHRFAAVKCSSSSSSPSKYILWFLFWFYILSVVCLSALCCVFLPHFREVPNYAQSQSATNNQTVELFGSGYFSNLWPRQKNKEIPPMHKPSKPKKVMRLSNSCWWLMKIFALKWSVTFFVSLRCGCR